MAAITLYGKPGCHLCDDARAAVARLAEARGLAVEEVDITLDPALHARFGERIPVVAVEGEVVCELLVDETALQRRLDRVAT